MSNKFLPFVVESSTPVHVFKTILRNSKGMNRMTIASIFRLVLEVDIKTLRSKVKELPEMQLEKLYEELLQMYPNYRIDEKVIKIFDYLPRWFPEGAETGWAEDLNQFGKTDMMLFFAALCSTERPIDEYTNIPFRDILPGEMADKVLKDIPGAIKLSDKAETVIQVKTSVELRAFLLYQAIICPRIAPEAAAEPLKIVVTYDAP